MESKVTGGEEENGERQKVERLVEKLKNYTTKNNNNGDGPSTPVHVSFSSSKFYSPPDVVSSRKLAAAFWEFHHYYYYYQEDHRSFFSPPPAAAAKMHRRQQRHGKAVVKENGLDLSQFLRDPSPDHQVSLPFLLQLIGLYLVSSSCYSVLAFLAQVILDLIRVGSIVKDKRLN